MTPDYQRAATSAYETLIRYGISTAPISPIPIIEQIPGVIIVSYTEMSAILGIERRDLLLAVGEGSQDAVTSVQINSGKLRYIIAYNQRLAYDVLRRSVARELGHIILGHDGSRTDEVRTEEARMFAKHLIHPRPLIYAIQQEGFPVTVEKVGAMSGCYADCVRCLQQTPGVHVDPALNRAVRDQFSKYLAGYKDFLKLAPDNSEPVDLGTYMEGYEE